MIDFNFSVYIKFLSELKENNYQFYPFQLFKQIRNGKTIILRHDVDRIPENALKMAKIEANLGVYGSYYFRYNFENKYVEIIKSILDLGHEVGYHYEEISTIIKKHRRCALRENIFLFFNNTNKELYKQTIINEAHELFINNLSNFRNITNIKTITMHGNPVSKYDNKIIWEKYDYKVLGIIGEPYFDIDWNTFCYLTDTGRKWNGKSCNVYDKVNSKYKLDYKSTMDIIKNVKRLPDKILFTIHPERWSDNIWDWTKQLFTQNIKNVIKTIISMNNSKYKIKHS